MRMAGVLVGAVLVAACGVDANPSATLLSESDADAAGDVTSAPVVVATETGESSLTPELAAAAATADDEPASSQPVPVEPALDIDLAAGHRRLEPVAVTTELIAQVEN